MKIYTNWPAIRSRVLPCLLPPKQTTVITQAKIVGLVPLGTPVENIKEVEIVNSTCRFSESKHGGS